MKGYLFDNLDNKEYMKEFIENINTSMDRHLKDVLDKGIPIVYASNKKDIYIEEMPDGTKKYFEYINGNKWIREKYI